MSDLEIKSSRGSYIVHVASGSARDALRDADLVLIDETVNEAVLPSSSERTIALPGTESTKTLEGCERVLARMSDLGVRRGDTLVAVGGGSIQDTATLVASLYMRGIPWVYCPSTAMAMTDSCIGGKSSINVGAIKNLVGNIYPPQRVVIDPSLADSLSVESKISGLAEAVKICFAAGKLAYAQYLELAMPAREFGSGRSTEALLLHVLSSKKWFIETDEFDRAERQLLNFGHTYAHALESATSFAVPHGVAVAVGVLGALTHPGTVQSDLSTSLRNYCLELLEPIAEELRAVSEKVNWSMFDSAVASDKKGTRDSLCLVLPGATGALSLQSFPRDVEQISRVRDSMASALSEVTA